MFPQTFPISLILAFCVVLIGETKGGGNDGISGKVEEDRKGILDIFKERVGLTEKELAPGEVRNWMNSFLHAKIRYGQIQAAENAQEFNVIFDSVYNLAGRPMNFLLYNCPEEDAEKKKTACKRHKMEIYNQSARVQSQGKVTTIDGVELEMKIVEDRMEYDGIVAENAKLMLLDGTNFKLFNPMLDSGAPGGPKMDGVFSLALGDKESPNEMEQLLEKKAEKIATVYMQPFGDLDFYSETTAKINIGEVNRSNCDFGEQPEWLNIVNDGPRKWKIGMHVNVKNEKDNVMEMPKQQVLISTMDSFIFAPESVTKPLMKDLKLVQDNQVFKAGRSLGKTGLNPKDVLIKCPEQEVMDKLPTFEFKFGSQTFTLTPKEYILKLKMPLNPLNDTHKIGIFNWCHVMLREKPKDGMYAKFVMPENNTDQWVFGQLFFNKACVAFKYGETPQLALAPPKAIANPSH